MLADPLVVAANSPNPQVNFQVIRSDGFGTERRSPSGVYAAVINHSTSKNGDRHYLQVRQTVNGTNPYSGLVSPQSASISISIAKPPFGFTDTDMVNLMKLMTDTMATATPANIIGWLS